MLALPATNAKPLQRFLSTPMRNMLTNKEKEKEHMMQENERNNTLLKKKKKMLAFKFRGWVSFPVIDRHD